MAEAPDYGKAKIGRLEPGEGRVDAQALDVRKDGQLAGREAASYQRVPPVKKAPWDWYYIPVYFWVGGIAAGSWLAATAEDVAGENDRGVVRTGRYIALGSVLGGTVLLILDLGRPERFLNMLRVVRPRSVMNVGSWVLTTFGAFAGGVALLQAVEDGLLGERPRLARFSRGWPGRVLHLVGLPAALLVGSYTGVLVASTSVPAWAHRKLVLPQLFFASAVSNGMAAVSAAVEATGSARPAALRRLDRAEMIALGAELGLFAADRSRARMLPSSNDEPAVIRAARVATVGAGIVAPLAIKVVEELRAARERKRRKKRAEAAKGPLGRLRRRLRLRRERRGERGEEGGAGGREAHGGSRRTGLLAAGLVLAGGLALRLLVVHEGDRSADTPEDTFTFAGDDARRAAGGGGREVGAGGTA